MNHDGVGLDVRMLDQQTAAPRQIIAEWCRERDEAVR